MHFLQLFREVFQHVCFFTTENKGLCHAGETCCGGRVLLLHYRSLESFGKFRRCIEKTGHKKIEDAPELRKAVLNRGSCQCKTVVCLQNLDSFRNSGFVILDILGFIQNNGRKI